MFGRPIHLVTILGFRIRLDWSWFIIAFLLTWSLATGWFPAQNEGLAVGTYWLMGAAGTIGLFVCVALHELGHAIIARGFGVEMRGITLFIFGGVAEMTDEPPTPKAEFWIAIAGPIVSVVLAVLFWAGRAGWVWAAPADGVIAYLAGINAILVAFNMIPAFPLDGGRVLRSILWRVRNSLRDATRITSAIGSGFGYALMGLAVALLLLQDPIGAVWSFLLGMFLRGAARMSYQQLLAHQAMEGKTAEAFIDESRPAVQADLPVDQFIAEHVYRRGLNWFPAVENGNHLVGWVDAADVKQVPRHQWSEHTVREFVHECGQDDVIDASDDAVLAFKRMSQGRRQRLCVMDDGRFIGVLSLEHLMKRLVLQLDMEARPAEPDLASPEPPTKG